MNSHGCPLLDFCQSTCRLMWETNLVILCIFSTKKKNNFLLIWISIIFCWHITLRLFKENKFHIWSLGNRFNLILELTFDKWQVLVLMWIWLSSSTCSEHCNLSKQSTYLLTAFRLNNSNTFAFLFSITIHFCQIPSHNTQFLSTLHFKNPLHYYTFVMYYSLLPKSKLFFFFFPLVNKISLTGLWLSTRILLVRITESTSGFICLNLCFGFI